MDNVLLIALTRQSAIRRALDVSANNLANMNTAGFKAETALYEAVSKAPAEMRVGPRPIQFVTDWGQMRDMRPGSMTQTGNPLDFAIEGDGFFQVRTPEGLRFTRDGQFKLNDQGQLVTASGNPVVGDGGEITIDASLGPISVASDGTISQGNAAVGRIGAVRFAANQALEKVGDNLFTSSEAPQAAPDVRVRQGMVEGSNVNAVLEMTRLIEMQRTYESVSSLADTVQDLKRRATERLGRAG